MTEDEKLHDEAEEIRHETAEGSPELAEHDRVAELERQLEEATKALYAAAETQNVRRRLEAEKEQASSYAAAIFARDMLAIKDNLDRALAAVNDELRADKVASQFLAGIEATARELEAVFARNGIRRIKSVGEPLDPHRHQAMIEMPSDQRAGHDRRGNAGRIHDEGPAASPGARRQWRKSPTNAPPDDASRSWSRGEARFRLDRAEQSTRGIAADLRAMFEAMARPAADQQHVSSCGCRSIRKSPFELFSYWQTSAPASGAPRKHRETAVAEGDDSAIAASVGRRSWVSGSTSAPCTS